ncbi:uncharacterized protein KY384_001574 [Bacidia gigantensis]|uniref:uncharacterized protein n=1 Tax=Bacidia gigantensis TaxID=2732470 RepID=UPI001D03973E|nr:uncharacterized protein KY384_001574 [Bacidia gigantensis]KAG8533833.1 hypothetical protein KY384_001574 [Bacidia gigantensis]
MAKQVPVPSLALLRSLRSAELPRQCLRAPVQSCGRGMKIRTPEEDVEHKKSFRAQLYESMADRVNRERAEETRYRDSEPMTAFGKNFSIAFTTASIAFLAWLAGGSMPYEKNLKSTLSVDEAEPLSRTNYNTPINLQNAWIDLCLILGEGNVSEAEDERISHSGSDWSSYVTQKDELPSIVVYPSTTEDVSKIMKMCHRRYLPVTAYSGGTSLEGHFAATRGGICIDFSKMDKILQLHKEDLDVEVQPAVGWEQLNEELGQHGLFFPPDPGPGAMIGGMVGTGCSGTNAYRYGTMKEWVLNLTVVLVDGTIIKTRRRPRKSSAGYDLTRTFIGSEGTLGLVTEATLKLTVKPKSESVAVMSFGSIRDAAKCVSKVVGEGVPIAAVELLDDKQMECINDAGSTSRQWKVAPTLFFKFGGTPNAVKEQIDIVKRLAKTQGSKSFDFAKNKDEADELWSARKEALWSVMAKRRDDSDHVWTTDVAVPISRLPDIVEETKADMTKNGILGTIVGHVGDGNFHAIILFNDKERKTVEDVVHRMVDRAIEMDGTATGEHGVGIVKRDHLPHELGQSTVDAMRKLKWAFDPLCLLNCDKIFRAEKPKKDKAKQWMQGDSLLAKSTE